MVFPIVGGNESKATQQNSLRLNDDDSPHLDRTISSGADINKFTYSFWVKRSSGFGNYQRIISSDVTASKFLYIRFQNSDEFQAFHTAGGSTIFNLVTIAKFRDVNAWYHIVIKFDSTQSTSSERAKLYINGNQITDLEDNEQPSQNAVVQFMNTSERQDIGYYKRTTSEYFDGYLADLNFIDGTASHTDFGEFDSTSNIWKHKDYEGSYGTYGYHLEFKETGTSQNATGIGADTSGNDNHFAVTNLAATDVNTDSPTNNFCTLNPLYKQGSPTFSEGNCKVVLPAGDGTQGAAGGIAPANGKWYWEVKHVSSTNSSILVREASDREDYLSYYEGNYAGYEKNDGDQNVTGNTTSTYGASYGNGDIIMVALDMDNDRVYFGKNGSWNDGSGNADEANLSDYVSLSGVVNGLAAVANANGSATATFEMNFGNPSFAISSSNADANGYGNFEYSVPSGYYALCTKNLAEFG
jgi:hypothetical protein